LVPVALNAKIPTLLDADALSAFVGRSEELFGSLHSKCLLTPHFGEFRRVFPDLGSKLEALEARRDSGFPDVVGLRGEIVQSAAKQCGCTVFLKGTNTWIASPDGRLRCVSAPQDGSAAWLATAGSGDVLAGFCTGLMARGMDPMLAGEVGARLHLECGRSMGPGLIADDLPEALPAVLRSIGCGTI
jgi:NAD(P)H-hydrate repair Nnr-like enzyme with NAD(P)H-hydrate dehydratase domain